MKEEHEVGVDNLMTAYLSRLHAEVLHGPISADVGHCVIDLYIVQNELSRQSERNEAQVSLLQSISSHFKNRGKNGGE